MFQEIQQDIEEDLYRHEFTDEELTMMLFEPDGNVYPVHEYHYMKQEWQTIDSVVDTPDLVDEKLINSEEDLEEGAEDNELRKVVGLNENAPEDEELVYLDLDTEETAQVVMFYAPWCPHCQHFKYEYVNIAREITRRSIGTPVQFHAVSCALYRPLCRAYNIDGFLMVYGWQVGSSVWEGGIELNPENEGATMTADNVADILELPLAHETKDIENLEIAKSESEKQIEEELRAFEAEAAQLKTEWHQYPSELNDRFHNAAVSLAFILKNGVYTGESDQLTPFQKLALQDFFELILWATPENWHASALVKELKDNMEVISTGRNELVVIVDRHLGTEIDSGLWGDLELPRIQMTNKKQEDHSNDDEYEKWRRNSKWTEACTHGLQGMGFTCGLWDLFHIITLGTSLPRHQLSGFRSGYMTSPRNVAEIIERFIVEFFPCDVCRFNFKDMYRNCGHGHCTRLEKVVPVLVSNIPNTSTTFDQASKEIAMWLWEVHNGVNIRIMRENAERQYRIVSGRERAAAVFPTKQMCPHCWLDDSMEKWNQDAVYNFLMCWYWPSVKGFRKRCERHIRGKELPKSFGKNTLVFGFFALPRQALFTSSLDLVASKNSVAEGMFLSIPLFVSLVFFVFFSRRILMMRKRPCRQKEL